MPDHLTLTSRSILFKSAGVKFSWDAENDDLVAEHLRKMMDDGWIFRVGHVEGNPPKTPPRTPQKVLEQARDRLLSLEADADNYKPIYRNSFRGGFSQCRSAARALLSRMIDEIAGEGETGVQR